MEIKQIESGSHRGDYLVEIDGVKKILTYSDILELKEKEKAPKIEVKTEPITFPDSDIEPTVADVVEAPEIPKKKKSRKKK